MSPRLLEKVKCPKCNILHSLMKITKFRNFDLILEDFHGKFSG